MTKPYPTITAYKASVIEPESFATLDQLQIVRKGHDLHFASGNFATVFKTHRKGVHYALKCFLKAKEDREERYKQISKYLSGLDSQYFVSYKYLANELWVDDAEYPVIWMEWVEGQTLGAYLKDICTAQDKGKIRALAEKFKELALWLLAQELAHGDLKHDNMLVKPSGDLVLVDYDGMYVPSLQGRNSEEIGSKGYQHPQRSGKDYHANLDDFSILVIYTTLLALEQDPSLLDKYEAGNNLIVSHADLENWASSGVCKDLRRLGLDLWADRLSEALQQQGIALPGLRGWLQGVQLDIAHLEEVLKPEYYSKLSELLKPQYASQLQTSSAPSTLTFILPGNVPLELVLVKAGSFMMGSPDHLFVDSDDERPAHQVTLTKDYYMGVVPVTQLQWMSVMETNPSYVKHPDHPVEQVSWLDVKAFLSRLNQLLQPSGEFILPTEAQWEYAAKGGEKSEGLFYANSNELSDVAWYRDNSGSTTCPVGTKKPNELGLYDMLGNVWEWCSDKKRNYTSEAVKDPIEPCKEMAPRVLKGGSWESFRQQCTPARRYHDGVGYRCRSFGFRICFNCI